MESSQRSEDTPRKKVEVAVDCATEDMNEPVTLTTEDIGAGGLFIKTDYPLETGTRFGCRFEVGDGTPILAECEVAWVRTEESDGAPNSGMGVQFVALEPDDLTRLHGWVTRDEATEEDGTAKVTFRIEGLGQTVPGEFQALSDDGMSAVAELPFLKVGSAVQVSLDDPGDGPKAGRIAWLVVEEPEEDDGTAPKIRLGIHFDESAEAALNAGAGVAAPLEPIPLTVRKRSPLAAPEVPAPLEDPTPAPDIMAPWNLDAAPATSTPSTGRRRRVRGRQKRGALNVAHLWTQARDQASRHPRIAMGVAAGSGVLLVTLLASLAFGGSGKPAKKSKKAAQAAAVVTPPAAPAPAVADPAAANPVAGQPVAPPSGPAAAPPLPGQGPGGRAALRSGPGANADPGKVLADPAQPGKGKLLADPKPAVKKRIHTYSLGRKLVVKLPLSTKPGRIKHYLLANPDGAVVDAAGAAPLLRPGRYKIKDSRIKMVKVLNRGKAARFIVYYGKGVKSPKIRLMPTNNGVNFVITTKRPAPRLAKRSKAARRGKVVARRRPTRKLRKRTPTRSTRRRPAPRRQRPAPVADASDD